MLQPNFDEGIIDPLGVHINGTGDNVPVLHLMTRLAIVMLNDEILTILMPCLLKSAFEMVQFPLGSYPPSADRLTE
jgi:hypothetical protein